MPDGSIQGPLTSSGVRACASDSAVDSRAQIRRIGDDTWRPITSVAGLQVRAYDAQSDADALAELERARVDAERAAAQRAAAERAEAQRAEAERAAAQRAEAEAQVQARIDAARADALMSELERARGDAERAHAEAEAARADVQRAKTEAERVRMDALAQVAADRARAAAEAQALLEHERTAAAQALRELQSQARTAQDEATGLQRLLATERDAFVTALRQAQDQLEAARAVQRDLAQEVEHARERASAESHHRTAAESARAQAIAELEQATRDAQLREADAQDRINRVQLLLDEAQSEMASQRADAERRVQDMMRRLQESAAHARGLEEARTAAEGQWMQACAERDEAIRDRDATRIAIGASQTELVHVRTLLDSAREEIASLGAQRTELTARIGDLEPALDAARARTETTEAALARSEEAHAALTEASHELRGRVAKLDAQLLQAHLEAERMAAEFEEARQHAARELAAQERSAAEAIAGSEARAEALLAKTVEEERRAATERFEAAASAHSRELAALSGQLEEERHRVVARDELIFRESLRAEERDRDIRTLQETLRDERTQALATRDRLAADHAAAVGALRLELDSAQQRATSLEHEVSRLSSSLRDGQQAHASEVGALQRRLQEETDTLRAAVDRESALREHAESGARAVLSSYEKLSDESGRRIADLEVRLSATARELSDAVSREQSLQQTLEEASGRIRSQTQRIGDLETERAAAHKEREQLESKLASETSARKKAEGAIAAATQRAERADRESKATLARAVQAASAALAGIRQRIEEDVERSRVEMDALDGIVRAASSQLIAAGATVPGLPQLPRDASAAAVVRLIEEQRAADAKRAAEVQAALDAQRAQEAAKEAARDAEAQRAAHPPSGPPRLGPASSSGAPGAAGASIASPRDAIDARARGIPFKLVDEESDSEAAGAGSLRARAAPRAPRSAARSTGDPGGGDGDDSDGAGAAVQPVANQAAARATASDATSPWDHGDVDDGPSSRERCESPAKVIGAVALAAGASAAVAAFPALRAGGLVAELPTIALWIAVAAAAAGTVVTVARRCSARLALRIPALAGASIAIAPAGALFAPLDSVPAVLGWIAASGGLWFLPWALAWAAWPASDLAVQVGIGPDPFKRRRRMALGAGAISLVVGTAIGAALTALGAGSSPWPVAPWSAPSTWIALAAWSSLPALALAWRLMPRRVAAARAADARIDPVVLARHERASAAASAALSAVMPLVPAMAAWLVARTRSRRGEAQMRSIVDFEWWSLAAMLALAVAAVLGLGWWPFAALMIAHACAMAFTAASLAADRVMRLPVPSALLAAPAGGLSLPRPAISVKRAAHVSPGRPLVHPCATSWALAVHAALVVSLGLPLVLSPTDPLSVPGAMRIISLLALAGAASWIPGWIAARLQHADAIAISGTGLLAALAAVSATCIAGPGSAVAQAALWSATLTWGALLAWASSALRLKPEDAARLALAVDRAEAGDMSAWNTLDDASSSGAIALDPGEAAPPPPEPLVALAVRATSGRVVAAAAASLACVAGLIGAQLHTLSWSAAPWAWALMWSAAASCALATLFALALPLARPRRGAAVAALAASSCGAAAWITLILFAVHVRGIAGGGPEVWMLVAAATLAMASASVSWAGATAAASVPLAGARAAARVTAPAAADTAPAPRRHPKSVVRKPSPKVTTGS